MVPPINYHKTFKAAHRNFYEGMSHDAIIGARYMDTVFNSEFVIVTVRSETEDEIPDNDEIVVVLEYADRPAGRLVEHDLETFKNLDGIYITHVPNHAQ